jgi:hypothetical protein
MACPSNTELHDLVTNELPDAERARVVAHVTTCAKCGEEVRQLAVMYKAVCLGVASEACPAEDALRALAGGKQSDDDARALREHVEKCRACEAKLRIAKQEAGAEGALEGTLRQEYERAIAESMGRRAAEAAMRSLLPKQAGLIDVLWDKVLAVVERLRGVAQESMVGPMNVALEGALGFSGASDPEVRAAWIILLATQATAEDVVAAGGREVDIAQLASKAALRCGAGKELAGRLSKTLPGLLDM